MSQEIIDEKADIQRLIGLADLCELMSVTFEYPKDEALATALVDGSYAADALSCLRDAQADEEKMDEVAKLLAPYAEREAEELHEALRKGNSVLFLTPGGKTPVWPYEAAFKYVAAGRSGIPSLFRSPTTVHVENMMKQAGHEPENDLASPCDSIWEELGHMAYLYGSLSQALSTGNDEGRDAFRALILDFMEAHLGTWVQAFMEKTVYEATSGTHSVGEEFAPLAKLGSIVADLVISDCNR